MFDEWPEPVRALARALDAAVAATDDEARFAEAMTELRRFDPAQVGWLLGEMTRELLERAFPDGLDTDDAEQVLASCLQRAAGWRPGLAGDALAQALTAALGIVAADAPSAGQDEIARHGVVLVAELCGRARLRASAAIEGALRELRRAQTVELP